MDKYHSDNHWYVAYTYPQCEKKADLKLKKMGFNTFLPLQKVIREWCDRKKKLEVPLFPNYIFVNSSPHQRFEVLKLKELVKFVSFEGKPAVLSEEIIVSLKNILTGEVEVSKDNNYRKETMVKIKHGQFAGTQGTIVRKNGKARLIVRIDALQTNLSVDVSVNYIESITSPK